MGLDNGITARAFLSSSWLLTEKAIVLALGLMVSVMLARSLGPAGFGELNYLLAIIGLLLPLSQLGVNGLISRALLEFPQQEESILNTALLIRAWGCLAALLLGSCYWFFVERADPARMVLLVLMFAHSMTFTQALEFWFQTRLRTRDLVPWRLTVFSIGAAAKMGFALGGAGAEGIAILFAMEYAFLGISYLLAYRRSAGVWAFPAPGVDWLRWFGIRAPWLMLSGIAAMVYLKIDIIMLERMRGVDEAGIYAVAARLSEVWYVVPILLVASLFTALWDRRDSMEDYTRGLQSTIDGLVAMAFALAVVMQFLALPLVMLLFGEEYRAAASVLALHIWAGVFVFPRALVSRWILAEDLHRFSLLTQLAGALVNVGANLLLIPEYGVFGAALATLFSYASAAWLSLFLVKKTRPMALMVTRAMVLPFRWRDMRSYIVQLETIRKGSMRSRGRTR